MYETIKLEQSMLDRSRTKLTNPLYADLDAPELMIFAIHAVVEIGEDIEYLIRKKCDILSDTISEMARAQIG